MNCIKCGAPVQKDSVCTQCGVHVDFFKKAYNTANYYYNCGLEKAQVRDLSGAINDLKTALKYKKELTDARNLLGLIYHEMGEVVMALSEWVISLHFQPDNNLAQEYINSIQEHPAKLENVNQVVKKYNQTLVYARQGNEDLAVIQLKKVLSLSPNFVNGYLLLALLYLKEGTEEKAKKALRQVLKIDSHNTTALRYLSELTDDTNKKNLIEREETGKKRAERRSENQVNKQVNTRPIGPYKEPASGMRNLVYILIGFGIAFLAMWVLVIPSRVDSAKEAMKKEQGSVTEELAAKQVALSNAEEENKTLTETNKKLEKELAQYKGDGTSNLYDKLLLAYQSYSENDRVAAAEQLIEIKASDLKSETAKQVYQTLSEATLEYSSNSLFSQGWNQYNIGLYDEALEILTKSYKMNSENVESLYFIARCYDRKGDTEKAKKYYNQLITDFPGTMRANKAQGYLQNLK